MKQDIAGFRTHVVAIVMALGVACSLFLIAYLIYLLASGVELLTTAFACIVLICLMTFFAYLAMNPDALRSEYTEDTLDIASDMLEALQGGLTSESAREICERLLPETRASTIAITDTEHVLACVGDMVDDFPPGSPIHTTATCYVIDHGMMQSFKRTMSVRSDRGRRDIPAGIVAPLKVRDRTIGTLKFYFSSPRAVNRTQYALAAGFAELLSTQLAIHELELQEDLTARAELRALQAQINPHFLFNTLNTIASLTRTDPLRARELLREFSTFYRSTLDNSGTLIPVDREIAQTKRYLTFERARFGEDRIQATFEVEEGLSDVRVPAFVIQPIVENAVRHGMGDEGALHIAVTVEGSDDGCLDIVVADDGVGMDVETASRLFSEGAPAPDPSAPQGSGAGVAMRNIFERIRRFYGPRSTAHVDSAPGEGTRVTLHLDLVERRFVEG